MSIGDNIKKLREMHDLTQEQLAEKLGVTRESVVKWESGKINVRDRHISKLVELFGIEPDDIRSENYGLAAKERGRVGIPAIKPSYSYHVVPIVGDVAAGDPCEAIELIDDVLTVPEAFRETHPDARALRIRGESMNRLFQADSYVIYDPELEVRDGDIAVVYVNGDDATVKRVYFAGDTVVLHPESTMGEHLDRAINTKDPSSPPVTFAGRVFWATWGDKDVRV